MPEFLDIYARLRHLHLRRCVVFAHTLPRFICSVKSMAALCSPSRTQGRFPCPGADATIFRLLRRDLPARTTGIPVASAIGIRTTVRRNGDTPPMTQNTQQAGGEGARSGRDSGRLRKECHLPCHRTFLFSARLQAVLPSTSAVVFSPRRRRLRRPCRRPSVT